MPWFSNSARQGTPEYHGKFTGYLKFPGEMQDTRYLSDTLRTRSRWFTRSFKFGSPTVLLTVAYLYRVGFLVVTVIKSKHCTKINVEVERGVAGSNPMPTGTYRSFGSNCGRYVMTWKSLF